MGYEDRRLAGQGPSALAQLGIQDEGIEAVPVFDRADLAPEI